MEMCQVNADAAQKMQALGRASAQEVLTAQKALQQANSSAQQAENGALQLKQNILMLLGFDADAPVTLRMCRFRMRPGSRQWIWVPIHRRQSVRIMI